MADNIEISSIPATWITKQLRVTLVKKFAVAETRDVNQPHRNAIGKYSANKYV